MVRNMVGQITLDGNLQLRDVDNIPPQPDASVAANIFLRDNLFVIQYNVGGTASYKYIDLSGTVDTWTHGTALP